MVQNSSWHYGVACIKRSCEGKEWVSGGLERGSRLYPRVPNFSYMIKNLNPKETGRLNMWTLEGLWAGQLFNEELTVGVCSELCMLLVTTQWACWHHPHSSDQGIKLGVVEDSPKLTSLSLSSLPNPFSYSTTFHPGFVCCKDSQVPLPFINPLHPFSSNMVLGLIYIMKRHFSVLATLDRHWWWHLYWGLLGVMREGGHWLWSSTCYISGVSWGCTVLSLSVSHLFLSAIMGEDTAISISRWGHRKMIYW